MPTKAYLAAVVALLATACVSDTGSDSLTTTADSAGVRIVRNGLRGISWDTVALLDNIDFRIGVADGDPNYLFDNISGIAIGPDGAIHVANRGGQIKIYDTEGRFVRALGRSGRGPGEFVTIDRLWVTDEHIVAEDANGNRVTFLDSNGGVETMPLFAPGDSWLILMEPAAEGWVGEVREMPNTFENFDWSFPTTRMWLVDPHTRTATRQLFDIAVPASVEGSSFDPRPRVRVTRNSVILGIQGRPYVLAVHDLNGQLVRRISRDYEPVTLDPAWRDQAQTRIPEWYAAIRQRLPDIEGQQQRSLAALDSVWAELQGDTISPVGTIHADNEGGMWVEREDLTPDPAGWVLERIGLRSRERTPASTWDVFDPDGRLLGTVLLPQGFEPKLVHGRSVTGVQKDEMDVETVVRLTIPTSLAKQ